MSWKHRLENLHDSLDGQRFAAPFFWFSGYFLALGTAAFFVLVMGLFLDKAVARPAFVLVALFGVGMIVDAIRCTRSR